MMVKLHFLTNSNTVAILGTFLLLNKKDLKRYVKMFPKHWIVL